MRRIFFLVFLLLTSCTFEERGKELCSSLGPQFKSALKDYNSQRYEIAIEKFDTIINILENADSNCYNNVTSLWLRGESKRNIGAFNSARSDFNRLLLINSKNEWGYVGVGDCSFYGDSNYLEALKFYEKAIEINARNNSANIGKVRSLEKLGKDSLAIEYITKVISFDQKDARKYYLRALIKKKISDSEGACEDIKMSIRLGSLNAKSKLEQWCNNSTP
jgi:tetratricopeptide (TPR) repeat protein